ncbi:CCT2 [Lepeophtheirus salmonis]|uniref:CCT2 n=1 Tax=Lepeophtheirus salmonis TaxID=72036 RepID=A0A7R8CZK5_LEPSM|nr:CCT2 [Lepeophtheirus salmonis]CAF2976302.1 CCT2 [Lepeophtheirus salmonis]
MCLKSRVKARASRRKQGRERNEEIREEKRSEEKDPSAMTSLNPVRVLKHEADEEKAETARLSSFVGAMAIGDLVKSTLGTQSHNLKAVGVDNPAAKVLVEMSKVQDDEVGDGTTSVTVLASELIREAEKLVELRIHPQTIVSGWRKATQVGKSALEAAALDHGDNEVQFRQDLFNIAKTTLSSKILSQHKDFFSEMAVDAVLRLKKSGNLDAIQIIKVPGGTLQDSFLDEGFILSKMPGIHQPQRIENAKILIANTPMDTDKIKQKRKKMKDKVQLICDHGINVFINRQLIYNYPEQLFADKGVMAIEHADFDGIERLALVTGVMIGEENLLKFSGVPLGEACSIIIRGATEQIIGEAERSLHDALCVLTSTVKETRTVYGGGCSEMLMANAVMEAAAKTPGKESRAMESFAHALRQLPSIIAENGGYDAAQLVSELRALHTEGNKEMGLNMNEGSVGNMKDLGITESFSVKHQVLVSASEAAEMIVRVDDIIKAAPRKRDVDRGHC